MSKLWGGRFSKEASQEVNQFLNSLTFDQCLMSHDIKGSIAHAQMLGKTGIISAQESTILVEGLNALLQEWEAGSLALPDQAEDVHTAVEILLIQKVGLVAKKLHTARSRNDQVALDTRLWVKAEISTWQTQLKLLLIVLTDLAQTHAHTIMPGFTHLQIAQPITLGHHLMAYFEMFKRDYERLSDCAKRVNAMPLGSGALAGTTFPIDRNYVAQQLNFSMITANSLDSVSDRDYIIELFSAAATIMMHMSRFAEEIIVWSSQDYNYVEVDDLFSTGSSIMPQKKNADVAELVRGKTGRIIGHWVSLITTMKGLPLAYNKDFQEDKEALLDTCITIRNCLKVFTPMIQTLIFNKERLKESAQKGFSNATDLADYLVTKGIAFRDAHEIVGQLVQHCLQAKCNLQDLQFEQLKSKVAEQHTSAALVLDETVYEWLNIENVVNRRQTPGGTSPVCVLQAVEQAQRFIGALG